MGDETTIYGNKPPPIIPFLIGVGATVLAAEYLSSADEYVRRNCRGVVHPAAIATIAEQLRRFEWLGKDYWYYDSLIRQPRRISFAQRFRDLCEEHGGRVEGSVPVQTAQQNAPAPAGKPAPAAAPAATHPFVNNPHVQAESVNESSKWPVYIVGALFVLAVITPWPGDEEAAYAGLILVAGGTGSQ